MKERKLRLVINNRPLAKVNGKVISLFDVVQKLNLQLYTHDSNYTLLPEERYQFYKAMWQNTLEEMIIDELILLDAEKMEIKVSEGEVRQEMMNRFGPNIMVSLNKVDLTYEKAKEMIKQELTTQKLTSNRVVAPVYQSVTPEKIQAAYLTYLEENPAKERYLYQILSIRSDDNELAKSLGSQASELLAEKMSLEQVQEKITAENPGVTVSVSEQFSKEPKELSSQYKSILCSMQSNSFSEPATQFSKYSKSNVCRIFHLIGVDKELPNSFDQMHNTLRDELMNTGFMEAKKHYNERLEKKFGFSRSSAKIALPSNYQPFLLL